MGGFAGKVRRGLGGAVRREDDVSPPSDRRYVGRGAMGGSSRTCTGDRFPLRQETEGRPVLRSVWRKGGRWCS